MTKSVTIQVSDNLLAVIEIHYETTTRCFKGSVLPRYNQDSDVSQTGLEEIAPLCRVWEARRFGCMQGGSNLLDLLTRSVVCMITLARVHRLTDTVLGMDYPGIYNLIDAYFLLVTSEWVAQQEALCRGDEDDSVG